jgi:septal ring-binding cell division protein DamX
MTIIYATSLAIIFYLGVLTGESLERKANAGAQASLGISPVPAPVAEEPAAASESSAEAPVLSEKNTVIPFESVEQPAEGGPPTNRQEVVFSKSTEPATHKSAHGSNESISAAGGIKRESAAHSKKESLSQAAERAEPAAMWTVQIAASLAKESSAQQLDRLKAKGYDGYIVETERDGRVWYRVRVGHFGSRAEAETLRSRLQTQEGFQNAFISRE